MKNRYFIEISFLGTDFHGWQVQPNAITVQEVLERSLQVLTGEVIKLTGAGRTDSGVHSSYFVAHFDSQNEPDCNSLKNKLNNYLSESITVLGMKKMQESAHARFDAISRTYKYIILRKKQPFLSPLAHTYTGELNQDSMNECIEIVKNTDDFTSFAKLHSDNKTNICRIMNAEWEFLDEYFIFTIKADRFLRNMIRALVGTILDTGRNKLGVNDFKNIISARDNQAASGSAPARGLYLTDIEYPESYGLLNSGKNKAFPFL